MNKRSMFSLIFVFLASSVLGLAQSIINTVAGGGPNNLPAVSANVPLPRSVATDSAGNLYIATVDQNQHRIFKVDSSGNLTIVAGNGFSGFSGDGGAATNASLGYPSGVAVDSSGNLYIADLVNQRVRRVAAGTGVITTVAGNGSSAFSGDGGVATSASLGNPQGVAVDGSGNLYVADTNNHRVRKVTNPGSPFSQITTVAGNGTGGFSGDGGPALSASLASPFGVVVDGSGNLYIADTGNHRIRKVTAATGLITTVAGNGSEGFSGDGGPATSARFDTPLGVAVDSSGNLYVADYDNLRVRRVAAGTGLITTVAGTGSYGFNGDGGASTSANLNWPTDVAVDSSGDLYIADYGNHRIRKVAAGIGLISTVAGNGSYTFGGDGFSASSASLSYPDCVAVDSSGNLYIADQGNSRIRKVAVATGLITTVAGNGLPGFSGDGGPATSASLYTPCVAVDSSGNLFVADWANHRIRKVGAGTGLITTAAGNGINDFSGDGGAATGASLSNPLGVAVDSSGNLYIADTGNSCIRKVESGTGIITTVAGNGSYGFTGDGGPATSASLSYAPSVSVDTSGNLYIVDKGNQSIRKVTAATGIITTVAGNGIADFSGDGGAATSASLSDPSRVAVDSSGNLYIGDTNNQRIRKVTAATGLITTVAGNGSYGFSGDGGAATSAKLGFPNGVAVDSSGNLYIADTGNQRMRHVLLSNTVTGPGVVAQPVDATTGASPVGMTFSNVSQAGTTSLTTSSAGPPPPAGFKLGNPPVYYDLSTTAVFSGTVTVCINYSGISFGNESNLKLMHHEGTTWVDRTVSLDTVNNIICAGVTSFSPFAILEGETLGPITTNSTATPNLVAFGTGFTLTANVTDTSTGGSTIASAEYSVDGGPYIPMNTADNLFDQVTESVTVGVAPPTVTGVYNICIRGRDSQDNYGMPECIMVPVYDPNAGFVTGGGWITSPVGAYVPNPSLAGKASFGFVSKYKKGQTVPTGETEFQFQTASFNFISNIYEWLVVSGARAQYKGSGMINGSGNYGFLLTAVDGQISGGGGVDKFRIKIWDKVTNLTVYDNQISSSDGADLTTPGTLLGGGSIVIHSIK